MNNAKFSVLIPAYNHERYIAACLGSIQLQDYQNFDIWVIDDCSADKTGEIVSRFALNDKRIHFLRNDTNQGVNVTVAKLFELSDGDYVCGVASDDMLEPGFLSAAARVFEQNEKIGVVYADLRICDEFCLNPQKASNQMRYNSRLSRDEILREIFLFHQVVWSPGRCLRRRTIDQVLPVSPALSQNQDVGEIVKTLFLCEHAVLDGPKCVYRVFGGNLSVRSELTTLRTICEDDMVMRLYLDHGSDEMLNRVFADYVREFGISFGQCDRRYLLGLIALRSRLSHKRIWGYRCLLNLVDENGFHDLYQKYGVDCRKLRKLSALLYDPKQDYRKKAARWRRRFHFALALLMANLLVAVCLAFALCLK